MPRPIAVGGGIAVLLLGFGILLAAGIGLRLALRIARLRREHPDEPWYWRPDWAVGRVDADANLGPWVLLCLAIVWNAAAAAGMVATWFRGAGSSPVPLATRFLAGGVLPAIGIVVLVFAIRRLVQVGRFGRPSLQMETLPAWLGEDLRGHLTVRMRIADQPRFTAQLRCLRRERVGRLQTDKTMDVTMWSREVEAMASAAPDAIAACRIAIVVGLVDIDLPTDPEAGVRWQLVVRGHDARRIGFTERYEVPVFARSLSR